MPQHSRQGAGALEDFSDSTLSAPRLLLQKERQAAEAQSEMKKFQETKAAEEQNKTNVQAIRQNIH